MQHINMFNQTFRRFRRDLVLYLWGCFPCVSRIFPWWPRVSMDDHGDTLEWGREVLQKVVERFHLNQMEQPPGMVKTL